MSEKALTKASAPFGSLQAVDYQKLEKTIEQMYFQGKNVSPEQKTVFRHAVERTGLDPMVGQIRPILRRNNRTGEDQMAIQTSIDGYRLIADRTGVYAGSEEPRYEGKVTVSDGKGNVECPALASVTVQKFVQGEKCSFTAVARWQEYYPGDGAPGFMWRKMPYLMLAKCAEALALRKAFPADLSGLYTDDEMQQADQPVESTKKQVQPSAKPTKPDARQVMEKLGDCTSMESLKGTFDRASKYDWTKEERESITECFMNRKKRIEEEMAKSEREGMKAA